MVNVNKTVNRQAHGSKLLLIGQTLIELIPCVNTGNYRVFILYMKEIILILRFKIIKVGSLFYRFRDSIPKPT